jgi:integrase
LWGVDLASELLTDYELYKRKDSANYWMRFSVKGKHQVRLSLKTSDPDEAEIRAKREHLRYQIRAEDGHLATSKPFHVVAQEYADSIEGQIKLGLKKDYRAQQDPQVIKRYLIPFFGKDRIDSISASRIQQFIQWRYGYWISGPGQTVEKVEYLRNGKRLFYKPRRIVPKANTVRGNCAVLSNVFKFAAAKDYVRNADIPRMVLPKVKPNPRPSFSLEEIHQLLDAAVLRLADHTIPRRQQLERMVLYCYINIACFSGLRPVELHNLNWQHIGKFAAQRKLPNSQRDLVIHAFGKTAPRNVVPMEHAGTSFDFLWDAFEEITDREPKPDDPVFINFKGERLRSVKRSLNALLDAAGLKTHDFGGVRVAYSFRHFYISQQLLANVDVYQVAQNAGTSVEMIQKFYARLGPEAFKKELRARWRTDAERRRDDEVGK